MDIGVIGDMHFKESLGYSEYIEDRRVSEREKIHDFIVESMKGCGAVVLMGDQLNSRSNHADTIRRFVAFLERFGSTPLFILGGNHEKWGDGRSSLDFLKEIKGKPWTLIIDKPEVHQVCGKRCVFLPFMSGPELGKKHDDQWTDISSKLTDSLPAGDLLFAHHAISGTFVSGMLTDSFQEVVLPQETLLKKYQTSLAGHIHTSGVYADKRIVLTGSVFNDVVGEHGKVICKVKDNNRVVVEDLPGRALVKLENPDRGQIEQWLNIQKAKGVIMKIQVTNDSYRLNDVVDLLKQLDGYVVVDNVRKEREQTSVNDVADLSIEALLKMFAKAKNLDESLLLEGYELIK